MHIFARIREVPRLVGYGQLARGGRPAQERQIVQGNPATARERIQWDKARGDVGRRSGFQFTGPAQDTLPILLTQQGYSLIQSLLSAGASHAQHLSDLNAQWCCTANTIQNIRSIVKQETEQK